MDDTDLMAQSVVQARDLWVRRGGNDVLRGLEFTISSGVVTGLLGPSGCGKTTVMRTVVGLQVVAGGAITVLGETAGTPSLRSRIGYAPQEISVYRDLTVKENVRYFASCLRAPNDDIERVLDQVELTPYADQLVATMSGGQQSRVNLAVALLGSPDLLVLDEPTVGLDPLLREQLWQLFSGLAASGVSLVVSSHVMDEAERCDDLLLMRDGLLLAHETPRALKERMSSDSLDEAFLRLVTTQTDAA